MGSSSSRPRNVNGYIHNDTEEEEDSENEDCTCTFLNFKPSSKRLTNKYKSVEDYMGTPIPDTPLDQRKLRRRLLLEEAQHGEFHTMAGSSSSQYINGLEKEPSLHFMNRFSSGKLLQLYETLPPAQVHEGENAEHELRAKYELLQVLGVGSTSTCHLCVELATRHEYACKIIDKVHINERFHGMMEQFHREISALRNLRHPNIIRLLDVYITTDKIYIVMELMEGGELFDYVVEKGTLNEEEASRIMRKVTSALVYMHSKDIIHRDLKPENLLLLHKPRSSRDLEVKIIDFGLSKCMVEPVARSFLGTRGYLAPEMLQRRDYSQAVDTWALGVICFVLLCGCLPFDDDSQTVPSDALVQAKFVLRFPKWACNLSHSAKDLLGHLLDINPKTRYTAQQALEHDWIRGTTASPHVLLASPGRMSIRKSPLLQPSNNNNGGGKQNPNKKKPYVVQHRHRRQGSNGGGRVIVRKTSI